MLDALASQRGANSFDAVVAKNSGMVEFVNDLLNGLHVPLASHAQGVEHVHKFGRDFRHLSAPVVVRTNTVAEAGCLTRVAGGGLPA